MSQEVPILLFLVFSWRFAYHLLWDRFTYSSGCLLVLGQDCESQEDIGSVCGASFLSPGCFLPSTHSPAQREKGPFSGKVSQGPKDPEPIKALSQLSFSLRPSI